MSPTARVTELVNFTESIIELFECEEGEEKGESCRSIQIKPNTTTEIESSRFHNNHHYSLKPRIVKVKRKGNNDFEDAIFSAHHFVAYQTFFFMNKDHDGNGPLEIELVPASKGILAHCRRTK